jgi:hypothetical protein
MSDVALASRLAERFRWPIALTGGASVAMAAADLLSWVSDRLTFYAAAGVGVIAAAMFFCAVVDMKFQRAVFALNADRRAEARKRRWLSVLAGEGLPVEDRVLLAINWLLLTVSLFAADVANRAPAAALGFAGCFLVGVALISLMAARGYPADWFVPPSS